MSRNDSEYDLGDVSTNLDFWGEKLVERLDIISKLLISVLGTLREIEAREEDTLKD